MKQTAIVLLLALLVSGCARTDISAYKDPKFSEQSYDKILVSYNTPELGAKEDMEKWMCRKLESYVNQCFKAVETFPPTQDLSEEEWVRRFREVGADSLLAIQLTDSYSNESYVPESSSTTGSASAFGNTMYYNQTTNTYGGYNVFKPVVKHEVTLFDGRTGKTAFVATSVTKGNAFANEQHLFKSLISDVVREMEEMNLVGKGVEQ